MVKGLAMTLCKRLRKGFTLIELLVVMAVVALLLTLAVPRYFGSLERSKELVLKENLKVFREVLDKFNADQGRFPDQLEELVDKRYIKALPVDPITETERTWVPVVSTDTERKGIVDVKSGAEGKNAQGVPYSSL